MRRLTPLTVGGLLLGLAVSLTLLACAASAQECLSTRLYVRSLDSGPLSITGTDVIEVRPGSKIDVTVGVQGGYGPYAIAWYRSTDAGGTWDEMEEQNSVHLVTDAPDTEGVVLYMVAAIDRSGQRASAQEVVKVTDPSVAADPLPATFERLGSGMAKTGDAQGHLILILCGLVSASIVLIVRGNAMARRRKAREA